MSFDGVLLFLARATSECQLNKNPCGAIKFEKGPELTMLHRLLEARGQMLMRP
jgi:hypothetical protein